MTLAQKYQNLERARCTKRTTWLLCGLPLAIILIYSAGISDTFVGWVFSNYLILLPSWPAVKKTFFLPEPVKKIIATMERLFVPRFFLRQTAEGPNGGEKLKSE